MDNRQEIIEKWVTNILNFDESFWDMPWNFRAVVKSRLNEIGITLDKEGYPIIDWFSFGLSRSKFE